MQTNAPAATPAPHKSRRRRYFFGVLLLLCLGTPIAYYLFIGWWADHQVNAICSEMDAADPTWRWADLSAELKPLPDDVNSASQILKTHALLMASPLALTIDSFRDPALRDPNKPLPADRAEALRNAFANADPVILKETRRLKDLPTGCFAPGVGENPFLIGSSKRTAPVGTVTQALYLDAILRIQRGDNDEAAESCQAYLNAIRALKDQPCRWDQYFRNDRQIFATKLIERVLAQGEVSEPMLQKLQALLEKEAAEDGMLLALRGERAAAHELYQSLRAGKTSVAELLADMKRDAGTYGPLLNALPNLVRAEYPDFLRMMNDLVEASKQRDVQRTETFESIEFQHEANFLKPLMSRFNRGHAHLSLVAHGYLRAAAVGIATERFRLKHHQWPTDVDDLVKEGFLREVPMDPWSGRRLRWQRVPTGVIVYSVGPNRSFNGGEFRRNLEDAFSTDLGFELWDPQER